MVHMSPDLNGTYVSRPEWYIGAYVSWPEWYIGAYVSWPEWYVHMYHVTLTLSLLQASLHPQGNLPSPAQECQEGQQGKYCVQDLLLRQGHRVPGS